MIRFLRARLAEPFSWVGLVVLAASAAAGWYGLRHMAALSAGAAGLFSILVPDRCLHTGLGHLADIVAAAMWDDIAALRPLAVPLPSNPENKLMTTDIAILTTWARQAGDEAAAAGTKAAEQALIAAIEAGLPGVSSDVQALVRTGWAAVQDAAAGKFALATDAVPFVTALAKLASDLEAKPVAGAQA